MESAERIRSLRRRSGERGARETLKKKMWAQSAVSAGHPERPSGATKSVDGFSRLLRLYMLGRMRNERLIEWRGRCRRATSMASASRKVGLRGSDASGG